MPGFGDGRRHAAAIAIGVGGAAGAGTRWAVLTAFPGGAFPWPVFGVNVAGSVLLGIVLAEEWSHPRARLLLHDGAGIGFCGGLTTFSTVSVEVVDMARDGRPGLAAVYLLTSVAAALAGVVAGAGALRRLRAVELPLEERP
jgi:fluoride exporter